MDGYRVSIELLFAIKQILIITIAYRYEDICPSTHNMDVPHVKREDYQLTDIDDEYLVLMNDNGDLREDLKIPEGDLGTQLRSEYDGGKELLVSNLTTINNQFNLSIVNDPFNKERSHFLLFNNFCTIKCNLNTVL